MKFSTLFVTLLGLLSINPSFLVAQRGTQGPKPIYRIDARRDGKSIGSIDLELFPLIAPKAVRYFDSLVAIHFYDSVAFHRVIPKFMIQGGDPNSRHGARSTWGYGDPEQVNVDAEFSPVEYTRGILGAARDPDTNSANSQFFICVANATHLNGLYTVYGRAVKGMNIADSIVNSPRDGNDNPLTKIEMFVSKVGSNDTVPLAPTLVLPAQGSENTPWSAVFTWTRSSDAVLYEVEISEDSSFASIVTKSTVGLTFNAVNGPDVATMSGFDMPFHRYYWRVRANNGGYYSPYSVPSSFISAIDVPQLLGPDSAATEQSTSQNFHWHAVPGAQKYHLRVATNPAFLTSATLVNKNDIVDTSYSVPNLQPNKTYYWTVSAIRGTFETTSSEKWTLHTQVQTGVADIDAEAHAAIYPQPASTQLVLPNTSNIDEIVVYDVHFDVVQRERCARMKSLQNDHTLDVSALPNGSYLIELRSQSGSRFVRAVVLH